MVSGNTLLLLLAVLVFSCFCLFGEFWNIVCLVLFPCLRWINRCFVSFCFGPSCRSVGSGFGVCAGLFAMVPFGECISGGVCLNGFERFGWSRSRFLWNVWKRFLPGFWTFYRLLWIAVSSKVLTFLHFRTSAQKDIAIAKTFKEQGNRNNTPNKHNKTTMEKPWLHVSNVFQSLPDLLEPTLPVRPLTDTPCL